MHTSKFTTCDECVIHPNMCHIYAHKHVHMNAVYQKNSQNINNEVGINKINVYNTKYKDYQDVLQNLTRYCPTKSNHT